MNGGRASYTLERDVACVGCGYNLRGLSADGRCPECGAPVAGSVEDYPLARPPEAPVRVDREAVCTRCGRAFRPGYSIESCPNCGAEAWWSLYGRWLRESDPQWLARVRSGFTLWLVAIGVFFLATAVLTLIGMAWAFRVAMSQPQGKPPEPAALQELIEQYALVAALPGLLYLAVKALVAFRVTTADPDVVIDRTDRVRRMVQLLALASPVLVAIGAAATQFSRTTFSSVLGAFSGLTGVALTAGLLWFAHRLALRIPARGLARSCKIVAWGLCLTFGLQIGWQVVMTLLVDPQELAPVTPGGAMVMTPVAIINAVAGCIMLPALLGFGIWYIVLLFQMHSAMTTALRQATRS